MRQTVRGIVIVLLVAMFAALGVAIGSNIATHFRNLFLFNEVLTIVQHRYVEKVEPSKLIMASIRGMLRSLDPHSQLLDAAMSKQLREEQKGSFYGIGIQFDIINGILTVIAPIEGTPAHRVGLLAGDRIVQINGQDARGITTAEVIKKLKGPKGTQVTITVRREGVPHPLHFTITRDRVPTATVPYYFMVNDRIGYIRLIRFSETTGDEMLKAVRDLRSQGMREMILDLRFNGGGLLNQAIMITDMFLDAGMPIVSTRGRVKEANQSFVATDRTTLPHMPLVILIDRGTASGAEIVAGAIQDLDRGIIVGERSFGKGLVQTVFQLPQNWTLILTTARYYTPSGRCIQRPYSTYPQYLGERKPSPEEEPQYETLSGRKVTGGGGIHPDFLVEYPELAQPFKSLEKKNIFTLFGLHYAALHRDLPKDFVVDDSIIDEFIKFAAEKGQKITKEELLKENEKYLRAVLKHRIARSLWGNKEAAMAFAPADVQLQKAIEVMPEAKKLLEGSYLPYVRGKLEEPVSRSAEHEVLTRTASDQAA